MDLSSLTTEDLMALKGGDLSKVSTQGLQALKQQSVHESATADTAAWQKTVNPTDGMSGMDKFNAGAGKAFADLGLGIRQRLGMASRDEVKESRSLDAPLMRTGAGVAGNIGGNLAMLAPTAIIPGAATVPGAAALGGAIGFLQPSASVKEDVMNTGLGAAGGAVGQSIANMAGNAATNQTTRNVATVARNEQKTTAAQNANKAGYVIPPEDIGEGGGLVTKLLSGTGGKIKTAQVASERNQPVTNALARKALGVADDVPLNAETLASVRSKAGDAYDVIRNSGTVTADPAYSKALDAIAQKYTAASQAFPGAVKSDIPDIVAALKQPQFSADGAVEMTKILRANADKAFASGDKGQGKAMKDAADAMEGMLERHLQAAGNPDALKAFQDARALIAKTYSVQKGLNTSTGDVAANALAKQLQKGKPLTGELRTIAEAADAFPRANQALKEAPKSLSPLDMALALMRHDPTAILTLGARPAARSVMLSNPMQRAALNGASTPQSANALLRALSQEQLTLPASFAGSNALAAYLAQQQ
jgi:hypothetical protein